MMPMPAFVRRLREAARGQASRADDSTSVLLPVIPTPPEIPSLPRLVPVSSIGGRASSPLSSLSDAGTRAKRKAATTRARRPRK
jgi:hypothetical protein